MSSTRRAFLQQVGAASVLAGFAPAPDPGRTPREAAMINRRYLEERLGLELGTKNEERRTKNEERRTKNEERGATNTMHVGILGGGNISATHARAAAAIPGVSVAAVWGQNHARAAAIAAEHGAASYDDLDRFLAHQPMDIVAIGSPSGLHADHAVAAVRRGLHVVVEKPLDVSTTRVDALLAEVERAGVQLGVFFQDRLKPDLVRVKHAIDAGRLGAIVLASAHVKWHRPPEYYGSSRWRGTWALDGGGALMNQGIHTVDVLLWLLGPIASVQAATATRLHDIEVEDTAVAVLRFASGALGVLEATTSVFPGYPRRVEITGAEGTLAIDGDDLSRADLRTPAHLAVSPATGSASATTAVVADITPHRRVLEDFIEAIRTGREPVCSGREGRRSVAVVEAIYESARSGNRVAPSSGGRVPG